MDIFEVELESPRGKEVSFTTRAESMDDAEELASKEYPRHGVTRIRNANTGEVKSWNAV